MTKDIMQRVLQARTDDGDALIYAQGATGFGGQVSAQGLQDSLAGRKWPRWLRLAIALGFASSVWILLLARLYL